MVRAPDALVGSPTLCRPAEFDRAAPAPVDTGEPGCWGESAASSRSASLLARVRQLTPEALKRGAAALEDQTGRVLCHVVGSSPAVFPGRWPGQAAALAHRRPLR